MLLGLDSASHKPYRIMLCCRCSGGQVVPRLAISIFTSAAQRTSSRTSSPRRLEWKRCHNAKMRTQELMWRVQYRNNKDGRKEETPTTLKMAASWHPTRQHFALRASTPSSFTMAMTSHSRYHHDHINRRHNRVWALSNSAAFVQRIRRLGREALTGISF